jgi:cytochrome c
MKLRYIIAMTAALSVSATAYAEDDGATLFKKSGCSNCHGVANKLVGPSMKDIAAKYKDDKEAHGKLAAKVRAGGSGSFGTMAMPATSKSVSDESIKTIVSWALSQK